MTRLRPSARLLPVAFAFAACGLHGRLPAAPPLVGPALPGEPPASGETYARIDENPFLAARDNPLSTFSIDVDTASYANVRRFLNESRLPPPDAVRIEELVNYFRYDDPPPAPDAPVTARTEVGPCPWAPEHRLLRIGLRARELPRTAAPPPRNLVFLVDVSGSMADWNKLPLVKRALGLLIEQVTERDRIAVVVYAGAAGVVLPPTAGNHREEIRGALERLEAGGSTNGAQGIERAYALARESFVAGGVNRVILATDGDFNVGVSSEGGLTRLIEANRDHGVYLTVLGFGMGNLKDATMEALADKGNGNYAYIDSFAEARKVLVEEVAGTLVTVAKDVKIQVEMNPTEVRRYRLLGYENRLLRREQFDDDGADAGDLGAGQSVTALYEIEPARGGAGAAAPLRYQGASPIAVAAFQGELASLSVRYKAPAGGDSRLLSWPIRDAGTVLAATSRDFRFAAAVATFGLALRGSPNRGAATMALAGTLAAPAIGDGDAHRREFLALVAKAESLARRND
jgi:Ca-activated chloride channel family protein